jgi:hypothetical protein
MRLRQTALRGEVSENVNRVRATPRRTRLESTPALPRSGVGRKKENNVFFAKQTQKTALALPKTPFPVASSSTQTQLFRPIAARFHSAFLLPTPCTTTFDSSFS